MESMITNELYKSASSIIKNATELTPSYLEAMTQALKMFNDKGLPSKKLEDWKYTNIAKNISHKILEAKDGLAKPMPKIGLDPRAVIVFNNGVFNKFLSVLPAGLELQSALIQNEYFDSFDCLNFASATRSVQFRLLKNTTIEYPITIVHHVDDAGVNKMLTPRYQFHAEAHSKAHIIEVFTSSQEHLYQYTTNASANFIIDDNAFIEHVKLQIEAKNSVHIGLTKAQVKRFGRFQSLTLDLGNLTARHNIWVDLDESGAETTVHGLYALAQNDHCDVFSVINHNKAQTQSDQLFKGILADHSHGVFTGKISVEKDAQQISSAQLNKNLVLSRKAQIDTRPQLLVSADDVKCAHGATVGQLSKEEEFYLESRGIPKAKAKLMLCHGFALEVLMKIENVEIKSFCEKQFIERFETKVLE